MPELQTLFGQGRLAVICNTGPLVEPLTRTTYQNGTGKRPLQLFSHSDQVGLWQIVHRRQREPDRLGRPHGRQDGRAEWRGHLRAGRHHRGHQPLRHRHRLAPPCHRRLEHHARQRPAANDDRDEREQQRAPRRPSTRFARSTTISSSSRRPPTRAQARSQTRTALPVGEPGHQHDVPQHLARPTALAGRARHQGEHGRGRGHQHEAADFLL